MAIAQWIVEEVRGIPVQNPTQFQGQSAPEGVVGGVSAVLARMSGASQSVQAQPPRRAPFRPQ
jgi:hypothetical protein